MITRLRRWIARLPEADSLRRETEENQRSADKLDRTLRELLNR